MRTPLLFAGLISLGGCSLLPPHDPSQAWIDLHTNPASELRADEVDDKPLDDDRFFQVPPGRHALQARLLFAVAGSDIGPDSEAMPRNCQVRLEYADFAAGERYRLVAGNIGFRAWAKLYDAQNQVLAKGREGRCGEF
ncbi:PA0061/PA0062 family lipoprotein [Zestomonas carbonaria]|uniref:Lipoprotein n=1 Tax=Zestomonas carbonaria TaxID=2762745 RepID=A0A7U7EKP7_9GAMM|nr:hypothetical protein [Pseudomonas carbonaria]CAD5106725.1 hypothetical protein PSEWESI4_00992 [Pseudomonas carbonaria]